MAGNRLLSKSYTVYYNKWSSK